MLLLQVATIKIPLYSANGSGDSVHITMKMAYTWEKTVAINVAVSEVSNHSVMHCNSLNSRNCLSIYPYVNPIQVHLNSNFINAPAIPKISIAILSYQMNSETAKSAYLARGYVIPWRALIYQRQGCSSYVLVLKRKFLVSLRTLSHKRSTARFFAVTFRVLSRKLISGDI